MSRLLLSLTVLLLLCQTGMAQVIRVTGADGAPLAGIAISSNAASGSDSTGITLYTDAQGEVTLPAGRYPSRVLISDLNYEPVSLKIKSNKDLRVVLAQKKNSLQEMVVTGVPRPMKQQNALAQYRVISRTEFQAQGAVNAAEALATRLNINIGSDQALGTTIRMQGMSGNKVKILIDGLPVNGREGGNVDLSQINLNNIERIETVQGPMSVVYGSDALGGVINLITRKNSQPWEASVGFNYETIGKYNLDFNAARRWGNHQVQLGGGRNFFEGFGPTDTTPGVPHRHLSWFPKEQYFANAAYNYTAKSGFHLHFGNDFLREKLINLVDAYVDASKAYGQDEYYRTTRQNSRLILDKKAGKNGRWELRNGFALYRRTRESVVKNLVTLTESPGSTYNQDTSVYQDFNFRSNYSNIVRKLKYDLGYDVSLQQGRSIKIPGGTRHISDYALYQNISYGLLNERLTLQAGFRESYNSSYTTPLTYSLQALYTPVSKVQLRGSYAKGFRAPALKEQYLVFVDQNHMLYGNPDLLPENGQHAQASFSYQPYQKDGNYVQVVLTGFYNDVNNLIGLAAVDPVYNPNYYKYVNIAHVRNLIANVQVEQQWSNLNLVLEYGLTHTYAEPGYSAFNMSEVTARANYYWKAARMSLNAFYKYTGSTANISEGIDGLATYNGTINAYHRVDASVSRKFRNKKIEVIAGVKNLLDVRTIGGTALASGTGPHATSGSGALLPRSLFTTLRLNLN